MPVQIREFFRQFQLLVDQIAADPKRSLLTYSLITPEAKFVLPDPTAPLDPSCPGPIYRLFHEQVNYTRIV